MLMNGWREVPVAPARMPHFHVNLLPEARKMSTTRALIVPISVISIAAGKSRFTGRS